MARHGHARGTDGSLVIHSDSGEATGPDGRLPRGNRLSLRLHYRRATGSAGATHAQQWIWRLPVAIAARARFLILGLFETPSRTVIPSNARDLQFVSINISVRNRPMQE